MKFKTDICPQCGRKGVLMYSNNPLSGTTICFSCIRNNLSHKNLEHAEFFCRTYNLPWIPELWLQLVKDYEEGTFRKYTELVLDDTANQPNLAYSTSTHDL